MANVDLRLAPQYLKEWKDNHATYFNVSSRQLTWHERITIVDWIKNNTIGDSIAKFGKICSYEYFCLIWYFSEYDDALKFKLAWS